MHTEDWIEVIQKGAHYYGPREGISAKPGTVKALSESDFNKLKELAKRYHKSRFETKGE